MEYCCCFHLHLLLLLGIWGSLCTSQQTTEKSFQCPEQFGYYSDKEDCNKYFVCVFGDALHESCTGGLHFSVELQTCDWPRNVHCPYSKQTTAEKPASSNGGSEDTFSSNRRKSSPTTTRAGSRQGSAAQSRSAAGSRAGSRYRTDESGEERSSAGTDSRANQLKPPVSWETTSTEASTTQTTASTTSSPVVAVTDSLPQPTTAVSIYYDHSTSFSVDPETSSPSPKETQLESDDEDGSTGDSPSSNRFPGYDPQQPQFDEAVPPVVDSEGRIHIPDGIYSNGPHIGGGDISVFVKPIYTSNNPSDSRNEGGQIQITYAQPQDEGHTSDREYKELGPILELTSNNGQPKDSNFETRFYRPSNQAQPTGRERATAILQLYRSNSRGRTENNAYVTQEPPAGSRHPDAVLYETPRAYEPPTYRQPDPIHQSSYTEPKQENSYPNGNQPTIYQNGEQPLIIKHSNNGHPDDPDLKNINQERFNRDRGDNRQARVLTVESVRSGPEIFPSELPAQLPVEPNAKREQYGYETQRDFSRYPQVTESPRTEEKHVDSEKPFTDYDIIHHGYSDQYSNPNKQNVFVARPRPTVTRTSRPRTIPTTTSTTASTTFTPPFQSSPVTVARRPSPGLRGVNRTPGNEPRPPDKLPSRPAAVYTTPVPFSNAQRCNARNCKLPDCRCGGSDIPGGLPSTEVPQAVMITFDDAINDLNFELYEDLFGPRQNPNGCPILGTFYVSHEWTDYGKVQTLYSKGHEMASHSITHSYGEKFSKNQWMKEINGQREVLNLYGGVKLEDVRGMRAPFLQIGGNKMFEMLYDANFTYDSSMPVFENNPPFWPYTLDYAINNECMITPCPSKSFPGVWQVGMVMWVDLRGGRCSMGDACSNPSDEDGVYKMLIKNFNRHYKGNRAPFGLYYHSAWFSTQHHRKGFMRFIDEINSKSDVWFLTKWQLVQWMRNPTPLSKINNFEPWQCNPDPSKPPQCRNPTVCNVWSAQGGVRYMKTCQPCPTKYPWVGKTN